MFHCSGVSRQNAGQHIILKYGTQVYDEQRGSPYDAKFNVAEIGAVNMGEIGSKY